MRKHITVCDICEKQIPDKLGDFSWKRLQFYEDRPAEDGYLYPDFCHEHALRFLSFCQKTFRNSQLCELYTEFKTCYKKD